MEVSNHVAFSRSSLVRRDQSSGNLGLQHNHFFELRDPRGNNIVMRYYSSSIIIALGSKTAGLWQYNFSWFRIAVLHRQLAEPGITR